MRRVRWVRELTLPPLFGQFGYGELEEHMRNRSDKRIAIAILTGRGHVFAAVSANIAARLIG